MSTTPFQFAFFAIHPVIVILPVETSTIVFVIASSSASSDFVSIIL